MSAIINQRLIHLDLEFDTKEEAIEKLSKIVLNEKRINSYESCSVLEENRVDTCKKENSYCYQTFLKNVLDREELSTTGIGLGIAIPHGKCCAVAEPTVVFGRLKNPIDWQSLDGKPVEAVFLLAVPSEAASNEHLRILAALSRKLIHEEFKEKLLTVKDKEELEDFLSTALT